MMQKKEKKNYAKWVVVDDKLTIDTEMYPKNSYGGKISEIFKNPDNFLVVFAHNSGKIATLISNNVENS